MSIAEFYQISSPNYKPCFEEVVLSEYLEGVVTKQGTEPLLEETSHMTFWQGHMTLCLGHMTLGLGHVTSHDPLDSPMPQ